MVELVVVVEEVVVVVVEEVLKEDKEEVKTMTMLQTHSGSCVPNTTQPP